MDELSGKAVTFNDFRVRYYTFGDGSEALVFIHGWTCDSSLWYKQDPLFRKHRSLLIDLPGHGTSDAPHLEYSQELFARAVRAILQEESISRVVLVGHSMGGPVSTMILRLFPDLVAGVIYVDSFFHSPETYLSGAERRQLADELQSDDYFRDLVEGFWTEQTISDVRHKVVKTMTGTKRYVRVNAVTSDSLPHAFRREEIFNIPAILIATPYRARIDSSWLHHVPALEILIWENVGHFLFMEDSQRFNEEVERFLQNYGLLKG